MPRKIAPMLRRFLPHFDYCGTLFTEDEHEKAEAELRALLAVARVARGVVPGPLDALCTCGERGGWECDHNDLRRALRRLERAGGGAK